MGFIEDELSEVRKLCEGVVNGSKLVSCVQTMVRVEIKRTIYKCLVVCIQFPSDYPAAPLLIELKSKYLSEKLLFGLTNVCEQECKKLLGKAQVLNILKFLRNFIDENPLSCCYDEINSLKTKLTENNDELKLKQKSSSISLKIVNKAYSLYTKLLIPDEYPEKAVTLEKVTTNFPPDFYRHLKFQAVEIARMCVEPPLKKPKPSDPPFKPSPSLLKTASFLVDCVKRLPNEKCQFCNKLCFPEDISLLELDETSPLHIERVFCGHLYHLECLNKYMKTPPFGSKKCQECGIKVSHWKWTLSDKLAEDRWAHEQARERELAEVEDFFK